MPPSRALTVPNLTRCAVFCEFVNWSLAALATWTPPAFPFRAHVLPPSVERLSMYWTVNVVAVGFEVCSQRAYIVPVAGSGASRRPGLTQQAGPVPTV